MKGTILCVLAVLAVLTQAEKTKVNVEVYYESLCMDSIMFIKNQLVPSYNKLKDHLSITYIPYGKASQSRDSTSNKWTFICQHGKSECEGNMAQACAIKAIQDLEKPEEAQNLITQVVGCAMSSSYPPSAVPQCGSNAKLGDKTLEQINTCRDSDQAADLHAANGDKTLALDPVLTFVPTIIVNGENRKQALRNFSGLICSFLTEEEKQTAC